MTHKQFLMTVLAVIVAQAVMGAVIIFMHKKTGRNAFTGQVNTGG